MPIRSWCIAALALLPTISSPAVAAQATTYRPEAEGFPCASKPISTVVSAEGGFAISSLRQSGPVNPQATVPSTITIGRALRIDRAIIERANQPAREVLHAHNR